MSNLIFSLNATLPLVIVACLGVFLRQTGLVDRSFGAGCDKLVFRVALPVTLFSNLYGIDIRSSFDARFVGFCAAATTLSIAAVWIGGGLFLKKSHPRDLGEFIQGSYRGSIAVLGNALLSNVYGSTAMTPMMVLGSVPLYNIAACLILAVCAPQDEREGTQRRSPVRAAFTGIFTNPIIYGIALGSLVSFLGIRFPKSIDTVIRDISSLTTPLSLLSIGIGFRGREALGKMDLSVTATILKLLVIPAVFLVPAIRMGFRGEALIALLIMLGSPSTPSCYTMARNYGYDGTVSASVVVLAMIGSAFSITLWILLLRTMGLV